MYKYFFFSFFITISLFASSYSQTIKGKIVNSKTNESIPYAEIYSERIGAITGPNGFFSFDFNKFKESDSLYFQCLGFKKEKYAINELRLDTINIISLESISYQISEVVINAKQKRTKLKKLGIFKKPPTGWIRGDNYLGSQRALCIENNGNRKGVIKNVQVYIGKKGNPQKRFRIHIYEAIDKDNPPGKELLPKAVYANGETGEEWIIIDLLEYNINYPKNGFFISVETIPETFTIIENNNSEVFLGQNYFTLRTSWEKSNKGYEWRYKASSGWQQNIPKSKDIIVGTIMMATEILVY